MALRARSVIWRRAGRRAEVLGNADDVVRDTGWVFNNVTGEEASLPLFVAQGDEEVQRWFDLMGLTRSDDQQRTLLEIGSGIGRMTAAFTRRYGHVIATDIDPGFLERCRETVSRHGNVARLETAVVDGGRSLLVGDQQADLVFSYITLQHCTPEVALELVRESVRVVRPGGTLALNLRTWSRADLLLWPAGRVAHIIWRFAPRFAERSRLLTRLGWQANRLGPAEVYRHFSTLATGSARVYQPTKRRRTFEMPHGVPVHRLADLHPSHYFIVIDDVRAASTPR
ncbi:MAG: hypothetical protein RL219_1236 [Actinomycetota bacterium]|jgi:SAM-dependent methyltransferase